MRRETIAPRDDLFVSRVRFRLPQHWANRYDRTAGAARPAMPARRSSALLLVPVDRAHPAEPRQRRAEPVLLLRQELAALPQDADAHHVGRLHPLARRRRIDRRAAARAERLHARIAAVRGRLDVVHRLAGHAEGGAGHRHRHAERRAGAGLAIGGMADRGLVGIGIALDGDEAAMARAVDFHSWYP